MVARYTSAASGELAIGVIGWWFIVAVADQLDRPSSGRPERRRRDMVLELAPQSGHRPNLGPHCRSVITHRIRSPQTRLPSRSVGPRRCCASSQSRCLTAVVPARDRHFALAQVLQNGRRTPIASKARLSGSRTGLKSQRRREYGARHEGRSSPLHKSRGAERHRAGSPRSATPARWFGAEFAARHRRDDVLKRHRFGRPRFRCR